MNYYYYSRVEGNDSFDGDYLKCKSPDAGSFSAGLLSLAIVVHCFLVLIISCVFLLCLGILIIMQLPVSPCFIL